MCRSNFYWLVDTASAATVQFLQRTHTIHALYLVLRSINASLWHPSSFSLIFWCSWFVVSSATPPTAVSVTGLFLLRPRMTEMVLAHMAHKVVSRYRLQAPMPLADKGMFAWQVHNTVPLTQVSRHGFTIDCLSTKPLAGVMVLA